MSALGERELEAVKTVFAGLERDVEVRLELGPSATPVTLLAAGGREVDTSAETRAVVEAVCALGERVHLEVTEHDDPGRWPCTTIGPAGTETSFRYHGMPLGYELTTLVHGIALAGAEAHVLTEASRERLATVDRDVAIDVYVTPT